MTRRSVKKVIMIPRLTRNMVRINGILRYVDILVAKAFLPNYRDDWFVRHINGICSDDRAVNLEMVEENPYLQV